MFNDLMNVVAGEMLSVYNFNTDRLEQQLWFMICIFGSTPSVIIDLREWLLSFVM